MRKAVAFVIDKYKSHNPRVAHMRGEAWPAARPELYCAPKQRRVELEDASVAEDRMPTADERRAQRRKLVEYEGRVEHMYLDVTGEVTVGIGHLLATAAEAQQLPFHRGNGVRASASEVKADYDKVKRLPYGQRHPASYYSTHATLRLGQADSTVWPTGT